MMRNPLSDLDAYLDLLYKDLLYDDPAWARAIAAKPSDLNIKLPRLGVEKCRL